MSLTFLGVDGGGTQTEVVITDETGQVLGRGSGPSCNLDTHSLDAARAALEVSVNAARAEASQSGPCHAAFLGLSGTVSPADRQLALDLVRPLDLASSGQLWVDHDARAALAGGLSLRPGLVLVAGTGSVCYGRVGTASALVGGQGHLLGDEGSGYWLGLEGLKVALRASDGRGAATVLDDRLRLALHLDSWDGVLHRVHKQGLSRAEIAALARLVLDAAAEGDAAALSVTEAGAGALTELVQAAQARLNLRTLRVVACGGALLNSALYFELTRRSLDRLLEAQLLRPERPPAQGAALLAIQHSAEGLEAGANLSHSAPVGQASALG